MIAVIADVHGNVWALEAVLADIRRRGITQIVNLGDSLWGLFDPAATADLLMRENIPSINGNCDRMLITPSDEERQAKSYQFTTAHLTDAHRAWLRACPPTLTMDGVLYCHGTPTSDETYLLEHVTEHGVSIRPDATLREMLTGVDAEVICCGHSHVPRLVALSDGRLIVNPGSVGYPAYAHETPYPHVMESGSPHARYAILSRTDTGWHVELIAVPYDWTHAANVVRQNANATLAEWIATGRATL